MRSEPAPTHRAQGNRVLVVSLPKAGTYLMAELLKALGYGWTGMHLAETAYSDYSGADLDEARRNPGRFARTEPLSQSLSRIGVGEFAVGHLPCKEEIVADTALFKRFYLTRDLRTALISYMRFMASTGRLGAQQMCWYPIADPRERLVQFLTSSAPLLLRSQYKQLAGWSRTPGVLHVRFEDLTGPPETALRVVESTAAFLGVASCDASDILNKSLESETITKSEGLSRLDDYWSPEAERQFVAIGGPELNAQLGCVANPPTRQTAANFSAR
jgi:hypothetical protein